MQQTGGKIAVVEIQVSDRTSAELHLQKSTAKPAELSSTVLLSSGDDSPVEGRAVKSPPAPAAPEPVVPQTPEANGAGESAAVSRQKTAKAAGAMVISSDEPGLEVADEAAQVEEAADKEPSQHARDSPGTPTGARLSRRSVRRSLMGKTSLTRRTSLAEKYSLASKRRSMTQRFAASTRVKKAARKSSVSSSPTDGEFECRPVSLLCASLLFVFFTCILLLKENVLGWLCSLVQSWAGQAAVRPGCSD